MTIAEINKFPKSKKKLSEFIRELLKGWNSMVSQGEEQPVEITEQMSEQAIEGLIWSNPRILYDFFDKENIYVIPNKAHATNLWEVMVIENDQSGITTHELSSRKEAEKAGYTDAFILLEEKL